MQPPVSDLCRGRGIGPCRLVAERGGVQAGIQHEPGSGPATGHLARQRHGCPARSSYPAAGEAVPVQPGRHTLQDRSVRVDPAATGNPHQPAGQLHYGAVIFAGNPQRVDDLAPSSSDAQALPRQPTLIQRIRQRYRRCRPSQRSVVSIQTSMPVADRVGPADYRWRISGGTRAGTARRTGQVGPKNRSSRYWSAWTAIVRAWPGRSSSLGGQACEAAHDHP